VLCEAEPRSPDRDGNATAALGRILNQKDNKKRHQARCNHTYGFLEGSRVTNCDSRSAISSGIGDEKGEEHSGVALEFTLKARYDAKMGQ
jgi:hypothetical protein